MNPTGEPKNACMITIGWEPQNDQEVMATKAKIKEAITGLKGLRLNLNQQERSGDDGDLA